MNSSESQGTSGIDELVLAQLSAEERKRSVVYLDRRPLPAGRNVIGKKEADLKEPRFVAFVDERPGANWSHPCRYLTIDPVTRDVEVIPADAPPVFGLLPSTWRVVWRPPGTEDWRLIRIFQQGRETQQDPDKKEIP